MAGVAETRSPKISGLLLGPFASSRISACTRAFFAVRLLEPLGLGRSAIGTTTACAVKGSFKLQGV